MTETKTKTMLFSVKHDFLLSVHAPQPPSAEDWTGVCNLARSHVSKIKGTLVYSAGGGPNGTQRKQLRDVWAQTPYLYPKAAVLNDSATVRVIITAMNLFLSNQIKSFASDDWENVFRYLELIPAYQSSLRLELTRLRKELGV